MFHTFYPRSPFRRIFLSSRFSKKKSKLVNYRKGRECDSIRQAYQIVPSPRLSPGLIFFFLATSPSPITTLCQDRNVFDACRSDSWHVYLTIRVEYLIIVCKVSCSIKYDTPLIINCGLNEKCWQYFLSVLFNSIGIVDDNSKGSLSVDTSFN